MWNMQMVEMELNRLSALKGDVFSIPVTTNGRLTSTLARVIGEMNNETGICTVEKMEFSKKILEHGTDKDIKEVISHEWCHYYLMKTTGGNHGHNAKFKELALEMGGSPGTTMIVEGYKDVKSKYEIHCTCCGKITGQYSRVGKVVKNPEQYQSNCCKANIEVIKNW